MNLTDREPCPSDSTGKKMWLAETREMLIDLMTDDSLGSVDARPEMLKEEYWYRRVFHFQTYLLLSIFFFTYRLV